MAVYSSFICNCQNVDTTKMSFSGRMDKYTVVRPDDGISFGDKKNHATEP